MSRDLCLRGGLCESLHLHFAGEAACRESSVCGDGAHESVLSLGIVGSLQGHAPSPNNWKAPFCVPLQQLEGTLPTLL